MGYLLGLDVGSSSVKACMLSIDSGQAVASAHSPATELAIAAPHQAGPSKTRPRGGNMR